MDPHKIGSIVTDARRCLLCGNINAAGTSECTGCGEPLVVAKQRRDLRPWQRTLMGLFLIFGTPLLATVLMAFNTIAEGSATGDEVARLRAEGNALALASVILVVGMSGIGASRLPGPFSVKILVAIVSAIGGIAFFFVASLLVWGKYGGGFE